MEQVVISAIGDADGNIRTVRLTVHDRLQCAQRALPCVVHSPSRHHMSSWPLNWRDDKQCMERVCEHGIGHPDPDHLNWVLHCDRDAYTWHASHGCDNCCTVPCSFLERNPMQFIVKDKND